MVIFLSIHLDRKLVWLGRLYKRSLTDSCNKFEILPSKLLSYTEKFKSLFKFFEAVDFLFRFILNIISFITTLFSQMFFKLFNFNSRFSI
jgi:hypothetical protein